MASAGRPPLTSASMLLALGRIAAWRAAPDQPVACPACEAAGLIIVDRSARPYAEWYVLTCPACGLDETINVPLGPAVIGGMD